MFGGAMIVMVAAIGIACSRTSSGVLIVVLSIAGWVIIFYSFDIAGTDQPTVRVRPPRRLRRRRSSITDESTNLILRLPPPLTRIVFQFSPVATLANLSSTHRASFGVVSVYLLRHAGTRWGAAEAAECERLYQVRWS